MTGDDLIAAGFKHFPNKVGDSFLNTWDDLYQKRVTDARGTRYFINVHRWTYPGGHVSWSIKQCYNDGSSWWDGTFWIETDCTDKTPAEVEAWADQVWRRLELKHHG